MMISEITTIPGFRSASSGLLDVKVRIVIIQLPTANRHLKKGNPLMWQQLHFQIDAAQAEQASDLLMELGALSVTLRDPEDHPIYEPAPDTTPLWAHTWVTALFAAKHDVQALQTRLDAHFTQALRYRVETLAEQDWVRAGQADFKPACFGGRLWIYPSWETPPADAILTLQLDPGMAFGTGTHATTAQCLEWLARQASLQGRRVLDYGCGSGILALAAAKLGAAEIWAVDHERQALQATRENAAHNGLSTPLHTCLPQDLPAQLTVEVLLANILANPLCELAPHFAELCVPGADLVLSGILQEQEDMIRAAYAPYFILDAVLERDAWLCISARRH